MVKESGDHIKIRSKQKILLLASALLLLVVLAAAIYVNDYYRADWEEIGPYPSVSGLRVEELDKGLAFVPDEPKAGLIFYPGGKVEHKAYIPLMEACASEGVLCVLLEMPFRLAVLDVDAAAGIPEQYLQVEDWYLAGHSLGGSMAAAYLEENSQQYEGLILLGSYSTADLSDSGLSVLFLYGSEDQVLNREKYEQYRSNLPEDFRELVLEGGCHAGFGMYGVQEGDGDPSISNEEQIRLSAEAILALIEG